MFKSVLIANRGEIAVRICRTLRTMGVRSVVVASIPDRRSLAVRSADAWVLLEGYSAAESYLDVDAVIAAAKAEGCDAIHPGYGFLSERADFAERCAAEGITFIGPPPSVLRGIGDKAAARKLAVENGVPVVPGWDGADDPDTLTREAERIGFPVMLKARGGGGGRGMREVLAAEELADAMESARREALAAFGDGGLLLERLVTNAHHVEVQALADTHRNVIHLGERDCSVQRRHQKLIEESPSPVVDQALRERLTGYALKLARAINYVNAGTFEFLVEVAPLSRERRESGASFEDVGAGGEGLLAEQAVYFLEVNPRLQVEHPVTEMVTGLDLVELQLRIAAGEPLPMRQEEVKFEGHAIEFRINAEDPWDGFKPSSGRIDVLWGDASRFDSGFEEGDAIPTQYDSLVAKRIFHGTDRTDAIAQTIVIGSDDLLGPKSNMGLLQVIARNTEFAAGEATIDWLENNLQALIESARRPAIDWIAAAATFAAGDGAATSGWLGAGRSGMWLCDGIETRLVEVSVGGSSRPKVRKRNGEFSKEVPSGVRTGTAWLEGVAHAFQVRKTDERVDVEGLEETYRTFVNDNRAHPVSVSVRRDIYVVPPPPLPRRAHTAAEGAVPITAPLAGTIAAVRVAEGDAVVEGQLLVVLEAMKMEHRITAPTAGVVKAVNVRERDTVRDGDVLVELV